jgi:CubicO group peptidase (beta-lactamase class C family)
MTPASLRLRQASENILPVNLIADEQVSWPIEERLAAYRCPGASVAVIEGGEVAAAAGFGLKASDGSDPVEADTMFAGASISKPLAAVLALQLADEGRIALDAPVNSYLDSWRIPENAFTRDVPVTLRHLLCHKAGTTVHGFGAFPAGRPSPTNLDTLLGRYPSLTPEVVVDKTPGEGVRYSGGGTQIVQLLLEEQTGLSFEQLAQERIFTPLGMNRSTFSQPLPERFHAVTACGHDKSGQPTATRFTHTPQQAAGGVYTTAPDYARFMVEVRNAWAGKKNVLLSQSMARQMMVRQAPGQFALGWELFGEGDGTRFGHGGSNEGFQCNTTCLLEQGKGVVVMTNALMGIILYSEIINAVASAFEWKSFFKAPKVITPVAEEDHNRYVGRYRIVSGISAPHVDIWSENGQLHSFIEGLILPPRPIFRGQNGRFFTQQTASETEIIFDAAGQAVELRAWAEGGVEILRAIRQDPG